MKEFLSKLKSKQNLSFEESKAAFEILMNGDASEAIKDPNLSWTQAENGLFMNRSIPGFYEEIAGEL